MCRWRGRTVTHLRGDGQLKERVISCNNLIAEAVTADVLREEWWKTFLYNTAFKISEYLTADMTARKLQVWNRHTFIDSGMFTRTIVPYLEEGLYRWRGRIVTHLRGDGRLKERVISCNSSIAEAVTTDVLREEWWKTFLYNTAFKISEYLTANMIARKLQVWNRHTFIDNRRLMMGGTLEERDEDYTHTVFLSRKEERDEDYTYMARVTQQIEEDNNEEDEGMGDVLAYVVLQESHPERVRFKVYWQKKRHSITAHLDHRIEFEGYRFDPTVRETVCIESAFSKNPEHKHTMGGSSGDKKLLRVTWGEWVDFSGGQSNKGNTGGWVGGSAHHNDVW